jgi:peptidoglycan hydrolase CwlO-like protein
MAAAASPHPPESPARQAARLRGEAAQVQATIDRMNDQVEALVERYDANQEALGRTIAAQAGTRRRIGAATRALEAGQAQLDQRAWDAYTTGPVTPVAALLGAATIQDVLTTTKYQERVMDADNATVARIRQARHALQALATQLGGQRRAEERLQAALGGQRHRIEAGLAGQRAYLARLNQAVRHALEEQRRRQEALARQALARRLAAARAAQAARAARARAAGSSAARSSARPSYTLPQPGTVADGAAGADAASRAVAFAFAQLGKPYLWGATGPGSYDCSGLTSMV